MKMRHYIIRRLFLQILVLFSLSVIVFIITHLTPGDPLIARMGARYTFEQIQIQRVRWGLDKPLHEQYFLFVRNLLQGNLGISIRTNRPVIDDIKDYLPATFELATTAMIMSMIMGITLGVISATKTNKIVDHLSRLISLTGVSTPSFWSVLLILLVFYSFFGWISMGRLDSSIIGPPRITGLLLVDSLITGNLPAFFNSLQHLILPAFNLGFHMLAVITRITRSSMLDVLPQDYIRTAHAKGLSENVVVYKHALRNALIPVTTILGTMYGGLLSGAVLTETIFAWPGLGQYAVKSFISLDYPAAVSVSLIIALIYSLINLIVDILYGFIDPRIRKD